MGFFRGNIPLFLTVWSDKRVGKKCYQVFTYRYGIRMQIKFILDVYEDRQFLEWQNSDRFMGLDCNLWQCDKLHRYEKTFFMYDMQKIRKKIYVSARVSVKKIYF